MISDLYIREINMTSSVPNNSYLHDLAVISNLQKAGSLKFHDSVTFFVGDNGVGKSTLIEAIAVAMGFNPEGGSLNFSFSTRDSHSELYKYIDVAKGARPLDDGFFLRAESFYNIASYIDDVDETHNYGDSSLHEKSHGEGFLTLIENRFRGNGIYILDEPESALSPNGIMKLMVYMNDLVKNGSQFIISTHSPILMTFPNAEIYQLTDDGITAVSYQDTEHFRLTKQFVDCPEQMLKYLLSDK